MKKYFTEAISLNGISTLLHTIEMPQDGIINLPQNDLGYYVGPDGQLYYPVIPLNKTFMGGGTLRELIWHAIRNIQRNLADDGMEKALVMTRKIHQIHQMLVGQFAYPKKIAIALCEVEGLDLMLKIFEEDQPPYKADGNDTINIIGVPVDRSFLISALNEAGEWYAWESDQPTQSFRQGWLLRYSIYAFNAAYDLQGYSIAETSRMIAERINVGHLEDSIPVSAISEVMACKEIPISPEIINV